MREGTPAQGQMTQAQGMQTSDWRGVRKAGGGRGEEPGIGSSLGILSAPAVGGRKSKRERDHTCDIEMTFE